MISRKSENLMLAWETFLQTPVESLLLDHAHTDPATVALAHFHTVAATVPAYQNWLNAQGINPAQIQTLTDFQSLPLLTKENYLRAYNLEELCRQGKLLDCDLIAVSSGSSGEPTFWPRFLSDELSVATRFEQIFRDSFQADVRRTLAVICFTLGTWVGGLYTANCCRHLAAKGYPIAVVAPGNNKPEIFRVLEKLAPLFEQVVLLGYPPFLKDVIDSGLAHGIPWIDYRVKLVCAGEVFSEEWRSLVGQRLGSTNFCYDSASLYGTADAGVLGNETPLSICIRRWLAENPQAAKALFGESRLPTLVQYDPVHRFFEVTTEGTLLFSGDNGIPLVRYHIADQGGLISYQTMLDFLGQWNFDPLPTLNPEKQIYPLPFVYIFGRSQFTVSYYGANIYPENITVGLEQPEVNTWVTGKFVLQVQEDGDRNPYLFIAVELAPGEVASQDREQAITASILTHLRRLNSEFTHYVPITAQTPQVQLFPTGNPDYFPPGVKHRYTRK